MNNWLRLGALALFVAQMNGCAQLTALQPDVLRQVQHYESGQAYGKALDVISATAPSHPQHARLMQKKAQLEAKVKVMEQNAARRAGDLAAQNRWAEALAVYREALEKVPRSASLRADLQEFRRRQAQRVEELKVDQLVARARWLERSLPVQESIVATDPTDDGARGQLERLRSDAADVAKELTRIGLGALDRNNLGLAGRTLPIASRLAPTPDAERGSTRLSAREAEQDQLLHASKDRAIDRLRQQEGRKLLADYEQASRAGDLRRSRLIMTRLEEIDGTNPEVARESGRLRVRLNTAVKRHMDEGNSLYGRGEFEEAMASWNRVLELDPDNEQARSSLERAGRVVDKLKQLREKQSAEPTAGS